MIDDVHRRQALKSCVVEVDDSFNPMICHQDIGFAQVEVIETRDRGSAAQPFAQIRRERFELIERTRDGAYGFGGLQNMLF